MKILYVGDLSSYARARQRFLAMQELGHLVEGISSVPIEKELAPTTNQPSLWERFRFDLLAFPDASSPRKTKLGARDKNRVFPDGVCVPYPIASDGNLIDY
jgi:hypothetical protein